MDTPDTPKFNCKKFASLNRELVASFAFLGAACVSAALRTKTRNAVVEEIDIAIVDLHTAADELKNAKAVSEEHDEG